MKAVEWFRGGRKRVIRGKKIVLDLVKTPGALRLVDIPATYGGFTLRLDSGGPALRPNLPERRIEIIMTHAQVGELIDSIFQLASQQRFSAQGPDPFLQRRIDEANKRHRVII